VKFNSLHNKNIFGKKVRKLRLELAEILRPRDEPFRQRRIDDEVWKEYQNLFYMKGEVDLVLHDPLPKPQPSYMDIPESLIQQLVHVNNTVVNGGEVLMSELLARMFSVDDVITSVEVESGIDGSTAGTTTFTSAGSNFTTAGVVKGDILYLHGANEGIYSVETVGTTTLTLRETVASGSNQAFVVLKSAIAGLRYIVVGTGSTAVTQADLVIETPITDANGGVKKSTVTYVGTGLDNKFKISGFYDTGDAYQPGDPNSLREAGIFCSNPDASTGNAPTTRDDKDNRMFNRTVYPVISKSSSVQLTIQWTVEVGTVP
jgi:hypothetical protein